MKETHVSLSESTHFISKKNTIPQELEKYFQGENREIFLEWVEGLDDEELKDFNANLSSVIGEAEKKKLDLVPVINRYKDMKLQKLKKNSIERWIERESRLFFLILSGTSILLFLFFGAIVMVGSIEKKMRNSELFL